MHCKRIGIPLFANIYHDASVFNPNLLGVNINIYTYAPICINFSNTGFTYPCFTLSNCIANGGIDISAFRWTKKKQISTFDRICKFYNLPKKIKV